MSMVDDTSFSIDEAGLPYVGSFFQPSSIGPYYQSGYNEQQLEVLVKMRYGYMAAFLDHPELGPILRRAAVGPGGPVSEQVLFGMISQTNWWQQTPLAARNWEILKAEDPASAAALAGQAAANIQNRARKLGLQLSDSQIQQLAITVVKFNWTDEQVVDKLIGQVNFQGLTPGDLTAFKDQVKTIAGNYLINVSDSTAEQYALRLASGEMSLQGAESAFKEQAKQRFTWMADQIDQGISPGMYFDPIKNQIARELEISPEEINLMDNKYLSMVEIADPETGKMRGATLREAQLLARKDERWANTSQAQQQVMATADMISRIMGFR